MKSYRYADGTFEAVYEIKRSKFIATVMGEVDGDSAETFVKNIKKKYADATHNCYAYIGDVNGQATRFSDDGEPGGTAGQPILEVLRKKGLVRTAVVVTRYFGGIKLGAGGLVGAYTESAVRGIECATLETNIECVRLSVSTDYTLNPVVDKLVRKQGWTVDNTQYLDGVKTSLWIPIDEVKNVESIIIETTLGKALISYDMTETEFVKID